MMLRMMLPTLFARKNRESVIWFLLGSNEAYVIYGTDVSDVSDVSSCAADAINRVPANWNIII